MKIFKKLLAVLLAGLMLLSLAACGGKDDKMVRGVLGDDGFSAAVSKHDKEKHDKEKHEPYKATEQKYYSNISAAIMDLKSGNISVLGCEKNTAEYIVAHNDGFEFNSLDRLTNFSMMTMDTNKEVYDILNDAIKAMKEDGSLESLIEKELKAYINSDPEAKDLPRFDGAVTIKIGVTGDLPPMDFVAANGKAAGFNIALLTEIANRAQVNFELVQIETGARAMALSSGKVDAVFWTKSITCTECNETWGEEIQGTLVTESYFSDNIAVVTPKSEK